MERGAREGAVTCPSTFVRNTLRRRGRVYLGTRLGTHGALLVADIARMSSLSLRPRDSSRGMPFWGTRRRNELGKPNPTEFETRFLSKRCWQQTSSRSSRSMRVSAITCGNGERGAQDDVASPCAPHSPRHGHDDSSHLNSSSGSTFNVLYCSLPTPFQKNDGE